MKKLVFMLGCALGICSIAGAQSPHTEFGIKGGLNISDLHSSTDYDYNSKASFNLGLLAHIHLTKEIAVQPEVLYSGQGVNYSVGNTEHHANINYINIPVLLQYMIADGFRLQTGPQLGLLLSAKDKAGNVSIENKSAYRTADFGWTVGAGYLTSSGLGVDARYNFGITDITLSNNEKLQNRVFQVGLFYQFKH